MMTAPEHFFFSSAAQYYVAGRFGVFAALNPVAANLMHHAIEMYLKGALLKTNPEGSERQIWAFASKILGGV
jgi:hypothetical protein